MAVIGEAATSPAHGVNPAPSKFKVQQNFRSWNLAGLSKACFQQLTFVGQLGFTGRGVLVFEQNIRALTVTAAAAACSRFTAQPGYL